MKRREFLSTCGGLVGASTIGIASGCNAGMFMNPPNPVVVRSVADYSVSLPSIILESLAEIGITTKSIKNKTVLLKPNFIEPRFGEGHINTHPVVIEAAIEVFKRLEASSVVVAEGSSQTRDFHLVLEETRCAEILREHDLTYVDLNEADVVRVRNKTGANGLSHFLIPRIVVEADIVVSLAKMKTHHWAGLTLSMKNMFGIMPGRHYGWPKNTLHMGGIHNSILDIVSTVPPDIAIVDGIVGMEGDGPMWGTPVPAGVLVLGTSPLAVDATCARIMGQDPLDILYMTWANEARGEAEEDNIVQRGEPIAAVSRVFSFDPWQYEE
jgi:uncharacterized protein (DUF362 family)